MTDTTSRAAGLLLVFQTVPPQHDEEFRDWYMREHIPEREVIDGFVSIRRLDSVDLGQPRYLGVYELTSLAVLEKPEYVRLRKEGRTTWSIRMLERVSPARFTCTAVEPVPASDIARTDAVIAVAGRATPETAGELFRWFDDVYRPALRRVDGVRQVRRFASADDANALVALVDIDSPEVCASDAYLAAREECGAERRLGRLRGLVHKPYQRERKA
jgi:hypothetical protein